MTDVTAILNARIYTVDQDFRVFPNGAVVFDERQPHLFPTVESEGQDPVLWNLVFAAQAGDVQHVWVGGRQVLNSRRLTGVDEDEALQAIHDRTMDLLKRRTQMAAVPIEP